MKKKFLQYLPECEAFCIADYEVKDLFRLELPDSAYTFLGVPVPCDSAPTIAFLCGREPEHYSIDYPYAYALAKVGARIVLLDYAHCCEQMVGCHGLVLPGGAFASPKEFYAPGVDTTALDEPGLRSEAYLRSLACAKGIPVLGICAGAQIIAGVYGGKLLPDKSYIASTIEHKTKEHHAHGVSITEGTLLHQLVGCTSLMTNSRHKEVLNELPASSGLIISAYASDGVPEAWESENGKILAVQWHPEDYVLKDDAPQHASIYRWLVEKAKELL